MGDKDQIQWTWNKWKFIAIAACVFFWVCVGYGAIKLLQWFF